MPVPSEQANDGDLVGRALGGRYRVTAVVGRGGMGVVARAVDELLGREVAVKLLRAYTDASPAELADLRTRMQREAQAAARIRHTGVVTVHDVTEEQGLPVIVMELVDGPSLDAVVERQGALDPIEAAAIGAQLMDALDAAHRAGVLHRDVKPGNVLLERGGRVVLTDFGIASMQAPDDEEMAKLTRSGEIVGSLDYLPPERAQGREPGPASDIWSLGMTLYAAVEGVSPFRRTSVWSTLSAIVAEPLPQVRRAGPLGPVLQALMAKEPEARPTAGQARAMLEAVAAGGAGGAGGFAAAGAAGAPWAAGVAGGATATGTHPGQPGAAGIPGPGGTGAHPVAPGAAGAAAPGAAGARPPVAGFGPTPTAPSPAAPAYGPGPGTAGGPAAAPAHGPDAAPATPYGPGPGTAGGPGPAAAPAYGPGAAGGPGAVPSAGHAAGAPAGFGPPPGANDAGFGGAGSFAHPPHAPSPYAPSPAQGGPSGQPPAAAGAPAGGRARRGRRAAIAVAVVGVLAAGGAAYALTSSGGGKKAHTTATPPTAAASPGTGDLPAPASPGPSPSPSRTGPSATPSKKAGTASPSASASSAAAKPGPVPTGCAGWTHKDPKPGTYGYISGDHHLLAAPYQQCAQGSLVKSGTKLWYHCYIVNSYGNQWTFVRVDGTNQTGWLYNRDLTGQKGSSPAC
ncbi:serine/threonine-protein kinase [Streptomyces sp. NPDC096136]|uniref:serine/threonine-protein kinase n=1 Tax=Streptomyces sp. NPDC096136 TaxID=3366076 RepID=UPI003800B0B0